MTSKADALNELQQAHDHFRATIAGLSAAAWGEVWLGSWTLAELLAHMAGWWRELTPAFERVAAGERPVPDGVDYSDADSWNARFAASVPHGDEALAAWDAAYAAYAAAASRLDADLYGENDQGRPKIGNRLLQGAGIGHFEEHQPELDAWLARRR